MNLLRTLIIPPISLLLLLALSYLISLRWRRAGKSVRVFAITALFVLSTNAGAYLFLAPLENLEPVLDLKKTPSAQSAQAVVILSAGRFENSPEYAGADVPDYVALARLRYGAKLARETHLPVLVTGGVVHPEREEASLALGMANALEQEFGVPVKWREERAANTRENANFSAKILREAGVSHVLLVTDAMHMRRSRFAFERAGIKVTSAPTVFFSHATLGVYSFLPSPEGLRRSQYAIYEWLGLVWYQLRDI